MAPLKHGRLILPLAGALILLLMVVALRGMNSDGGADGPSVTSMRSDTHSPNPGGSRRSRTAGNQSSVPQDSTPEPARDRLHQILAADQINWPHLVQVYADAVNDFSPAERGEWALRFAESAKRTSSLNADAIRAIDRVIPGISGRVAFARAVAGAMIVDEFLQAEELAQSFGEAAVQKQFLKRIARNWARDDVEAAANWANSLPPGSSEAGWSGLIDGWAEDDPEALLAWAEEHGLANASESATGRLARRLALTDPRAAVELSNTLPPSGARTHALGYALNQWAGQETQSVIAWADEQTDQVSRELGRLAAARVWLKKDPEAAAEWIETLDGSSASALRRKLGVDLSEADLGEAQINLRGHRREELPELQRSTGP